MIFNEISDITPEIMAAQNIKGMVLDIDNTLAPRYTELPDEQLKRWITGVRDTGVKLYIISNNRRNRVSRFAEALDLPFICRGMKPFPSAFRRAAKWLGLDPGDMAAVGDQIYTDVIGAHSAGMKAWLVTPIDPNENIVFKIRRRLEKPYISRYYRNNGGGEK